MRLLNMEEVMKDSVVAIGAHVDDIEVGCAGSLHKWISYGDCQSVHVVYFTPPDNVVDSPKFKSEYEVAMKMWGFDFNNNHHKMHFRHIPVRRFTEFRTDIRQYLWDLTKGWSPDLVLVPSRSEFHQDHQVVTEEAMRVFRRSTMLGYEMPMISLPVEGVMYSPLDAEDMAAKEEAVGAYVSQHHRASMKPGIMEALARVRGNQIGMNYAEVFEVIRWIDRS